MSTVDYAPYLTAMKQADCCIFWFIPFHAVQFINQSTSSGASLYLRDGVDITVTGSGVPPLARTWYSGPVGEPLKTITSFRFQLAPRPVEGVDLTIAFFVDPSGVRVELTRGLDGP